MDDEIQTTLVKTLNKIGFLIAYTREEHETGDIVPPRYDLSLPPAMIEREATPEELDAYRLAVEENGHEFFPPNPGDHVYRVRFD